MGRQEATTSNYPPLGIGVPVAPLQPVLKFVVDDTSGYRGSKYRSKKSAKPKDIFGKVDQVIPRTQLGVMTSMVAPQPRGTTPWPDSATSSSSRTSVATPVNTEFEENMYDPKPPWSPGLEFNYHTQGSFEKPFGDAQDPFTPNEQELATLHDQPLLNLYICSCRAVVDASTDRVIGRVVPHQVMCVGHPQSTALIRHDGTGVGTQGFPLPQENLWGTAPGFGTNFDDSVCVPDLLGTPKGISSAPPLYYTGLNMPPCFLETQETAFHSPNPTFIDTYWVPPTPELLGHYSDRGNGANCA